MPSPGSANERCSECTELRDDGGKVFVVTRSRAAVRPITSRVVAVTSHVVPVRHTDPKSQLIAPIDHLCGCTDEVRVGGGRVNDEAPVTHPRRRIRRASQPFDLCTRQMRQPMRKGPAIATSNGVSALDKTQGERESSADAFRPVRSRWSPMR
jgi:hypothetical protein